MQEDEEAAAEVVMSAQGLIEEDEKGAGRIASATIASPLCAGNVQVAGSSYS